MSDRVFNVLFLCTGNTARSILAESILRKEGRGRFRSFSAGSQPKGQVNPYAIRVLERAEYPTEGLRSKNWSEFAAPDAPVMDFVFTVCDSAAGESCPVWPGQPMTAHWGIEDPAAVDGTDLEKEAAFVKAQRYLKNRIVAFANLPLSSIDKLSLGTKLREIGRMDGSTIAVERRAIRRVATCRTVAIIRRAGSVRGSAGDCAFSSPPSGRLRHHGGDADARMLRWRCSATRCRPAPSWWC